MIKVMNFLNHFGYSGFIILSACDNGFYIKNATSGYKKTNEM
jgi:hypothetical protein